MRSEIMIMIMREWPRKLGRSVLGLEEEQRRQRQSWMFSPTAPTLSEEPPPSYQQAVSDKQMNKTRDGIV